MKKIIRSFYVLSAVALLLVTQLCFAQGNSELFKDVQSEQWYAESVEYVFQNELMNGVTEDTFAPDAHITRGMIVTIIYRMEGLPATEGTLSFSDVNKENYYATPVLWATENKIVNGYRTDIFAPEDKITREQFAAILYRYAKHKGVDVSIDEGVSENLGRFSDSASVSDYATASVGWASDSGIITGVTESTLEPQGNATRAQAATIFMRFDKLLDKLSEGLQNDQTQPEVKGDLPQDNSSSTKEPDNDKDNSENNNDENAGEWDDVTGPPEGDKLENPTIWVKDVQVNGKYAEVVISVVNNPGIASIKLDVKFDDENLRLASVDFDLLWGDYITAPTPYKSPQVINFISPFEDVTGDGRLVTLRFEILDDDYDENVIIEFDKNNTFDSDFNFVEFNVINGKIK